MASVNIPYFPLYPTDFEAKTSHLNLEEDGAYNRLLRLSWMMPACTLPDDPAWIARRMRVDMATFERVVEPILAEFFKRANGRVWSPRLLVEWKKADATYKARSEAGKKGGRPKVIDNKEKDQKPDFYLDKGGPKQPEPEPEPYLFGSNEPHKARVLSDKDSGFDRFWAVYPLKKAKAAAEKNWLKAIKKTDPEIIIAAAAKYAQSRDVSRGFAKYAQGWLTDERWKDGPEELPIEPERHYGGHRRSAPWGEIVR